MTGATICRVHGAGKGSPARDAADRRTLSELIGPALTRLKELVESRDTPDAVVLGAIREILSRSGYNERYEMTYEEIEPHVNRLIAEMEAEKAADELARGQRA